MGCCNFQAARRAVGAAIALAVCIAAPAKEIAEPVLLDAGSRLFRVVDGDSVNYAGKRFRLCGIQAPERGRHFYRRAGDMLKKLLGKAGVTARIMDIDKYGRLVAVMYAEGSKSSVNEQMVRLGGAKHYTRFSRNCIPLVTPKSFSAAESRARKSRLGIWNK